MHKTILSITTIQGIGAQEMAMRDIMGSMEELANMINIQSSTSTCEILSIEPPHTPGYPSSDHPQGPYKRHTVSAKSRILPFPKK